MEDKSAEIDGDELCKIGERAGAVALHALKLDGAAAAETDQHVAIERAADCNAVAIRLDEISQVQHVFGGIEIEDRVHAVAVPDKVDEGVGAFATLERVIA